LPTTNGLPERAEAIAEVDAPVVARVRASGAVIMGKTNVPPYAGDWQADNPLFGRTNNPWDLTRTPGGSTGGGAAALAAGLTPLELGLDLAGSIRVPAAFCGVYGHRPSQIVVPHRGHFPDSNTPGTLAGMSVQGPLARSAEDLLP
jgi:amidase